MPSLLADVLERNHLGTPVVACLLGGLAYLGLELGVEDEIDIGVGITPHQIACQIAHGRAEGVEILLGIPLVLHFTQWRVGPGVIGAAEDQDDVGAAQVAGTGDKGAVGVVVSAIAGVANGGTTVGVVGVEFEATLLAEQVPPGLCDIGHIGLLGQVRLMVPHGIASRQEVLVGAVGVTQHRDGAHLGPCAQEKREAEQQQKESVSRHCMSVLME